MAPFSTCAAPPRSKCNVVRKACGGSSLYERSKKNSAPLSPAKHRSGSYRDCAAVHKVLGHLKHPLVFRGQASVDTICNSLIRVRAEGSHLFQRGMQHS